MSSAATPDDHILAALPTSERGRLFPHLKLVPMPLGLYESGATLRHIYFPIDSIVSLLYVMEDGDSAEIAVVGNEGAVGVSLFMGGETTPSRAIVQSAGHVISFVHIPVVSGSISNDDFQKFSQAAQERSGKVHAFCRTGTRAGQRTQVMPTEVMDAGEFERRVPRPRADPTNRS